MANTSSNGILSIFVVIIVIIAALAAAVVMTNNSKSDSNPNGILGTYDLAEINQCGRISSDEEISWVAEEDYKDMKFVIESYDDLVIKGKIILGERELSLVGYYDPDTGVFGYGCNFEKTLDDGKKLTLIDCANGMIVGNTIYLAGYTMQIGDTDVMYVFNYTFVKAGQEPVEFKFDQKTLPDYIYGHERTINVDNGQVSQGATDISGLELKDFKNGVYHLEIGGEELLAATLYQDDEITVLRGISSEDGYTTYWMYLNGDKLYIVNNNIGDGEITRTTYTEKQQPELSPYSLKGKEMYTTRTSYSFQDDEFSYHSGKSIFTNRLNNTLVTPMEYKGTWTLVGVLPDIDHVVYTDVFEQNGTEYHSQMIGFIDGDGDMHIFGFAFGDNGDVRVSHGTMEEIIY